MWKIMHRILKIKPVYITDDVIWHMFKKILAKLKFGACKTAIIDDVNAFKESEKKKTDVEK